MFTKKLCWLFYLVPFSLIAYSGFDSEDFNSDLVAVTFELVGAVLSLLVLLVGFLFAFNRTQLINAMALKVLFWLALVDETIGFIDIFAGTELLSAKVITFLFIIPIFILLWLAAYGARKPFSLQQTSGIKVGL
ncbi:hypothetical protein [uncultured Shewanella sp.]|uniref:hypothetical protein n=1 Tax=uncultured Shewanella sp. TaxID=173975 RepID=UPI002602BEA5|nr:hypothetical protein [uncultured Shewanella sp.]